MHDLTAKRTLVKSPPELWSEVSEVERLARHLGAFGEITITKLEPERTVSWEGERASGTVSIEPSGWGTKVTLWAQIEAAEPAEEAQPAPTGAQPEAAEPEPEAAEPEPAAAAEPEATEPEPPAAAEPEATAKPEPNPPGPGPVATREPEPDPPESEPTATSEPDPRPADPDPPRKPGFFARLFSRGPKEESHPFAGGADGAAHDPPPVAEEPQPEPPRDGPQPEPEAQPEPPQDEAQPELQAEPPRDKPRPEPLDEGPVTGSPTAVEVERAQAVLDDVLEALGSAHHRPFSRS